MSSIQFHAHTFSDFHTAPFPVEDYSHLKFGSNRVARKFGFELANAFAEKHMDILLSNRLVVIPSPYNHVANAATILTHHFVNRLNQILTNHSGEHVDYSIIHRKVSYINDYGFLSKEDRKGLIDNDSFYLNKDFFKDKVLLFLDDVIITGTHEDKLKEILTAEKIKNDTIFVYYAKYEGNDPTIESRINFAAMKSLHDYSALSKEEGHHVIVRPLKFLLTQNLRELADFLLTLSFEKVEAIYFGCLGEGYYKIPAYQGQFQIIKGVYEKLQSKL